MPPAAMALISDPSITFQPTDASIALIASSTSIVSMELASSPPSSSGSVKRKNPSSTSCGDTALGKSPEFLCLVAPGGDDIAEPGDTVDGGSLEPVHPGSGDRLNVRHDWPPGTSARRMTLRLGSYPARQLGWPTRRGRRAC